MAYVEGNLDWMRETGLDITRELDQSNGYSGNQPVLLQTVGSIGPDPRLLEPALPLIYLLVYLVPLDPSNLPALDFRVIKWQVATPSHVRPSRVPGKVDTPEPRCIGFAHACPDEIKFECAQLGDSTGDT
ncbi:hypothetical protein CRG98_008688 [Punica granatum]|uniref:Uncharacterized protein n=1 Tax=Punica granatum TaxID=22663 RepID=A0A2I0KR25_PUNGR|nr:hypothetical protein CRG98_008688 [Punica granatum]